ncbi:hypothetical protein PVAND_015384 [Polypedilum vanderplanki]|uniref:Zinc finger protein n=1 Tax=Polypedilum vanderplanki TaxID=319348 RepID=A0A9J6BCY4_POLVA|nr:hypothetical protein PVAND_015384 [Polypedilum vanderplanki]
MSTSRRLSAKRNSHFMENILFNVEIKAEPEDFKSEILQVTDENFYCRICFKIFQLHDNKNEIDNGIISTLRDLIQFGLKLSTGSQMMCDECSSLITSFYNFKNEVIDKQAKFAQLVLKNRHQSAIEIQKISNRTHEFDQLQCSEVFVKQEPNFDIPDFYNDANDPDYETELTPNKRGRKKKIIKTELTPKRAYVKRKDPEKCEICGKEVFNFCDYSTYEKRKLQYHTQNKHSKKLKSLQQDASQICPHCAKQVRCLDTHIANIHLGERYFFCDLCTFSSYKKKPLEQHMMSNHLPKSVKCSLCDFATISLDRLKKHIRNQHEVREPPMEFPCTVPECGKAFRNKFNLLCHVKRCHEGEVKFPCPDPECTKQFFTKSEQKIHFQNSHGPKNVVCDECGSSFSSVAMLRKHSTLHQEYQYPCTFPNCGIKYRNSTQLKNHMNRIHLDKKDYECEECGAAFYTARDLDRHIVSKHLGIKFVCEVPGCSSTLSRRDAYLSHLKSHSGLSEEHRRELIKNCNDFCIKMNLKK